MRVLVTGATGVYGRSVVERLHRAGHDVIAMARNPPKALPHGVSFAAANVGDLDAVTKAMDGCEVVCHLAFVVTPIHDREESRRISVGGTANVLEAMRRTGARRLVQASSAMSYGANPDNPPLFTEQHEQRPAPDYVYGTDKVAAERLIIESGIEAVLARTAVTVGRNIDNLLVDIFAAPAIVGIKDVDIRYQLVHQDDIGRFFAYACEQGPPGPVNVSPPDFLPLHEIARILGKRYVEVTAKQALRAIEFMWEHDLADITPGEAAGISYLPRMATDRLQNEWGFECAWSTAEAVLDLRRAVAGITSVAKRRVALPWRLQFPTQRPGDAAAPAGTYTRVTEHDGPLPALTLSTHTYLLRSIAPVATFGNRLYLGETAPLDDRRRRMLSRTFAREVRRIAGWAGDTLARAERLDGQSDTKLDATLAALRDELAWFWSIASIGAALDGEPFTHLDGLITALPSGAPLGIRPPAPGAHAAARAQAELAAVALGQALAAAVRVRAARVELDAEHLTFDELLAPPPEIAAIVKRRRAEHRRVQKLALPDVVSVVGPQAALNLETKETRAWTPSLTT
ncbi:MAG TPA: NAD-dependent epimerase/dehydratase family protein [Solirubrobacteraceae bacterium]|jgi:nucleoside-diphosphate-sugar epimerase|nr:NAD-dependent epimerase/dehydratase family protein [Solirubrobacteraceae bacterium]